MNMIDLVLDDRFYKNPLFRNVRIVYKICPPDYGYTWIA